MIVVSEQQHAPQQSPFFYACLFKSQTMNAENIVILVKNKAITPNPQKKQKLERASIDDVHPRKKAAAFVNEVMEMEAPAWIIPCCILFSIESLGFV